MKKLTTPPHVGHKTFLYSELVTDLTNIEADIAILGMPFSSAYSAHAFTNDQSRAPQYLRDMSDRIVRHPDHYDFDIDGRYYKGGKTSNLSTAVMSSLTYQNHWESITNEQHKLFGNY